MSEQQERDYSVPADLLKKAAILPANAGQMTEVNPFEREPRLRIGEDPEKANFLPGMTIVGYYAGNKTVQTPKSKYAKETIVHLLRIGSPTGDKLGIWTVAELEAFFENMPLGTLVTISYKSKGVNADGNAQHYFKLERGGLQ